MTNLEYLARRTEQYLIVCQTTLELALEDLERIKVLIDENQDDTSAGPTVRDAASEVERHVT
jgi:hypothetical protein